MKKKWVFVDKESGFFLSKMTAQVSTTKSVKSYALTIRGSEDYAKGFHDALIHVGLMGKKEYRLEETK